MCDHKGAGLLIDALPPARELIANRGYDSNGFRAALEDLGIAKALDTGECFRRRRTVLPSCQTAIDDNGLARDK